MDPLEKDKRYKTHYSGYQWAVIFVCFMSQAALHSTWFAYGIFVPYIVSDMESLYITVSSVIMLNMFTSYSMGIFIEVFIWAFDWRGTIFIGGVVSTASVIIASFSPAIYLITIFYGFINGLGLGLIYYTSLVCLQPHFPHDGSMAVGFVTSGAGFGTLIGASFESIIVLLGWRNAMRIQIGFITLSGLLGLIIRRRTSILGIRTEETIIHNQELNNSPVKVAKELQLKVMMQFKDYHVILATIASTLFGASNDVLYTFIAVRITESDDSSIKITTIYMIVGGVSLLTRLILAWFAHLISRYNTIVFLVGVAAEGVTLLALSFITEFYKVIILTVLFGIGTGIYWSYIVIVIVEEFGMEAFGVSQTFVGLGVVVVILACGGLVDITGYTDSAFQLAAALVFISAMLFTMSLYSNSAATKHDEKKPLVHNQTNSAITEE